MIQETTASCSEATKEYANTRLSPDKPIISVAPDNHVNDDKIYHIYDKIFKKMLTLSSTAVINLINGLFQTNYPTDSKITYNWTEFVDNDLKKVLADTIITINDKHPYHMEAQIENDDDIVFRVFDYGYKHAEQNKIRDVSSDSQENNTPVHYHLYFPEPHIIYIDSSASTPDEYILEIHFASQGSFIYKVKTYKLQEHSSEDLDKSKMIILIPFKLLTLRKIIEKERTRENLDALHSLIYDDILENIVKNVNLGNISLSDGIKLYNMTKLLYKHLYSQYKELDGENDMTDESIMFPIDELEKKYETLLAEKDKAIEAKDKTIKAVTAQKDAEISALKEQLAKLQKQ